MKTYVLWMATFFFLALSCLGCQKSEPPSASRGDSNSKERLITSEDRKAASNLLKDIRELERQGRGMESLRRNQSLESLKQCGQKMRELQKIADELRNRAESLPRPLSFHLGVAAIESKLCVSCISTAKESCDRVKAALAKAKEDIEEVAQKDVTNSQGQKNSEIHPQTTAAEAVNQQEARETVGKWRNESAPAVMNSTIEIYREGRKFFLQVRFDKDGSTANEELRKEAPGKFRRINHPGDYFVVTKAGYLEARDREGLVFSARPMR